MVEVGGWGRGMFKPFHAAAHSSESPACGDPSTPQAHPPHTERAFRPGSPGGGGPGGGAKSAAAAACCCFVTVCARAGGGGRAAVVEIKISSGGGRVRESPETQGGMVLKGVDAGVRGGGLTRIVGRSCGWGMVGVHKTPINGRTKTKTTHKGKSQTGAGKEETTGGVSSAWACVATIEGTRPFRPPQGEAQEFLQAILRRRRRRCGFSGGGAFSARVVVVVVGGGGGGERVLQQEDATSQRRPASPFSLSSSSSFSAAANARAAARARHRREGIGGWARRRL